MVQAAIFPTVNIIVIVYLDTQANTARKVSIRLAVMLYALTMYFRVLSKIIVTIVTLLRYVYKYVCAA